MNYTWSCLDTLRDSCLALIKLLYGFDWHEENLEADDFRFLLSALRIPSKNHSNQDSNFTLEKSEESSEMGVVKLKRSRHAFSPKNWSEESSEVPKYSIPTPIQEPDLHNYSRQSISIQPHTGAALTTHPFCSLSTILNSGCMCSLTPTLMKEFRGIFSTTLFPLPLDVSVCSVLS